MWSMTSSRRLRAEVDVDVGHLPAVGVQEAFEKEVVAERLGGRDVEHVADQRVARRPPPRAGDALGAGPADDVVHHQEVVGEAQPLDHLQLVLEQGDGRGRHRAVEALDPAEAALGQQRVGGLVRRDGHLGEVVGAEFQVDLAARGDQGRACPGARRPAGAGRRVRPPPRGRGRRGRRRGARRCSGGAASAGTPHVQGQQGRQLGLQRGPRAQAAAAGHRLGVARQGFVAPGGPSPPGAGRGPRGGRSGRRW